MIVAAFILAITASASLAMADDSGIEPQMRDPHLPAMATVTVRGTDCKNFALNRQEARDYLGKAVEVTEHDYFHMLDWSPCSATGRVRFKNGVTGIWRIQQYRAGSLKFSNGRTVYLYCSQCQAKALLPVEK